MKIASDPRLFTSGKLSLAEAAVRK